MRYVTVDKTWIYWELGIRNWYEPDAKQLFGQYHQQDDEKYHPRRETKGEWML